MLQVRLGQPELLEDRAKRSGFQVSRVAWDNSPVIAKPDLGMPRSLRDIDWPLPLRGQPTKPAQKIGWFHASDIGQICPSVNPKSMGLPRAPQWPIPCTISSVIFFASPNSIIVFGRKNSSLSTPAYPEAIDRFTNSTVAAFSTSRIGIP